MNFFEQQAAARRDTTRLIVLFAMAVVGIVLAVDAAAWAVYGGSVDKAPGEVGTLLTVSTLLTLAIIGLGSLYRIASLRGGGDPVALQFGGVPVPEGTTDLNLKRLRNVVEEIAIASGVPVPRIYVLEQEQAINAFAAGYSPSDAVIAVTRGALDRLNRDELQGVIAHEFSHILNGDMRMNIRLMGVLFGILMLAIIGRKVLQFGGRSRSGRGAITILTAALIAMVVGYIGLFFARMIKAGVSRTRESLADASAVQFTRQTEGLAGALKKIAGVEEGSRLNDRADAEEASHMLFGDGVGFSGLFATHPPLLKRIQALEPHFRADELDALQRRWLATPPVGIEEDVRLGLDAASGSRLPDANASLAITPPLLAAQVAQPAADDYKRADTIVATIPEGLRTLAAKRDSVMPLVMALLLDDDAAIAQRQRAEISARLGEPVAMQASAIRAQSMHALHPMLRLPLASLAFPVLRLRPRPDLDVFLDTVQAVVNADGQVSLFEYCLGRLLQWQIRESLDPAKYARYGRRKLADVGGEIATLLRVVAQAGNDSLQEARMAYLSGMQRVLPNDALPYQPMSDGVLALDGVWEPLDALDPLAKQSLIEGITATISHDNRVTVAESELLRTICCVLHCPLPPMLERA